MTSSTLKGRVARGLWSQVLFVALEIGQRFLLVPLYLYAWPLELYGEWLVIQAAVMFLPLADLGMMPYFCNATAMAWARGDRAGFERLQRVAFGLYAVLLAVAVPAYVLAVVLIARAGGLGDGAMSGETRALVWLLLGLYHILVIPHGLLTGLYRSRTSFALEMYAVALKELTMLVVVAAVLMAGASPVLVAATHLVMGVLMYAPIVAEQRRRYHDLRHGFALPTRAEFRSFVGHLGWFTALPAGERLIANGPILVLGLVASEAAVVVFSTLRVLSGFIRTASERVSYLAGAEMSNFFARGEREPLVQVYLFTGRLAIGVAGFAAGALYVVAEPFLAVWTGGKVPYDGATLVALLAALVFASHGHICYQLVRYTNRPRAVLPLVLARALTSLVLGGALAAAYGPAGMAAGLALSEVTLMGLLLPLRLHRVDGLPFWRFLSRNLLTVALAFVVSLATAKALLDLIGGRDLLHLAVVGGLWGALMVPPALFLLLDADHRAWLLSGAQRALRRTARRPASSP